MGLEGGRVGGLVFSQLQLQTFVFLEYLERKSYDFRYKPGQIKVRRGLLRRAFPLLLWARFF